jgi:CheY-like chemotaxis protein
VSEQERTRHTILVIEDDPDIAESLCDVLESEGYQVVTASNGKEGLDRLREIDRPSLILLDLMMPVMSGGEFLAVLRQTDGIATIPVVVVSAWPGEATQVRAQVQGFVNKPVSLDALLEATHKVCAQGGSHHGPGGEREEAR